jgi:hypothetical protein
LQQSGDGCTFVLLAPVRRESTARERGMNAAKIGGGIIG